ncbi:MAG: Ig-like domain-containing protein [Candidatus Marinimicrobia bacterium]|nr:Ig-like domain-containing protein [Candidatus Neomarinimicrobiota bacterium]
MRNCYIFGIIFVLFSCKEAPIVIPPTTEDEIPAIVEVDTTPPIIKWISPRFDAVVQEIITIKCEVTDTSGLKNVDLFIDGNPSGVSGSSTSDSTFEFTWQTTSYTDGSEPQLYIYASDNEGNDTSSQIIRVIVDNNHSYPNAVDLYLIDSVFTITDTTFIGYNVKWQAFSGSYFSKYILQRSDDPLMINSSILFSTSDKSIVEYEDDYTSTPIMYYRIVVENIFGKQTPGNVISTTMSNMPMTWDILSVNYTESSLSINWSNPQIENYLLHQLLFSNKRDGAYELLQSFSDSSISQFSPSAFIPNTENWFSVHVEDSLGQISMSQPYMHPHPQEPLIDSVLYNDHTFTIHWATEPDGDFIQYQMMQSENENPFDFTDSTTIEVRTDTSLITSGIIESEYYIYQIITKDAWELETRGNVIIASSFYKFSKTIGGDGNDELYAVIPKDDGGYLAVGNSFNEGSWLVKISGLGIVKDSIYFSATQSLFRDITNAWDGGFILSGYSRIDEKENILVVKLDDIGNQEWLNNFAFNDKSESNAAIGLSDGSIGITGYSNNNNNQDILVLKLDADGNELWSKAIGGSKSDEGHDILALEDGGLIVLGETHSQGDDDGDIWILKFDSKGNSVDTLLISMAGKQVGNSFVKTNLNEYVIGGLTSGNSGVTDAFIIKVNELGEVEWEFSYGGIYNDIGYSIIDSDGGWVLVGQTYSYDVGGGDILLLKVNDFGELEWVETIGGSYQDSAYDIKLASDKGFIISGTTYSQNNTDGWLIKTDSRGNYKGMLTYP